MRIMLKNRATYFDKKREMITIQQSWSYIALLVQSYRFEPFLVALYSYRFSFSKLQCFVTDYSVTAEVRRALPTVLNNPIIWISTANIVFYSP
jgi:hypothetical protein